MGENCKNFEGMEVFYNKGAKVFQCLKDGCVDWDVCDFTRIAKAPTACYEPIKKLFGELNG